MKANRKQDSKKVKASKKKIKQIELPSFWTDSKTIAACVVALLITFFCFLNSIDHQFVNWDDDKNIYENEYVSTINDNNFWDNSKKIFTSTVIGNYNPLSIWTFALEKKMFGLDNPDKWHRTNVMLHLLCVFLIFRISMLLGLKWYGALVVALLFGIHPMRVESVAWVTERKDVLFGSFYLSAFYLYIRGKLSNKRYTFWILLLFVLSLFSKIQAVILPLSMLAADFYLNGKIDKKDILNKLPYFILSLAFGLIGILFLSDQGSFDNAATYPVWQRIFVGSYSYLIYLIKFVFPYQMSPMYPYAAEMPWYFYPTILLGPGVLYALYYTYKNNLRVWFFGLGFFTVNIMFLLQILGAGQGFLADRFTYISYFGLFFIVGYLFNQAVIKETKFKIPGMAILTAVFIFYGYSTIQQNKVWANSETLWSHVLKYYKNSTLPYGNRANYFRQEGRIKEALADYSMSISLKPDGAQAYNSRARLYFDIAKTTDTLTLALQDYSRAIQLDPQNGEFHVNRGATYARLGNLDAAINDMNLGIQYKPNHAVGYLNRSVMYNQQGKIAEALKDIDSYLNLNPYNANIWYEKGRALRNLNQVKEAIPAFSQAIKINNRKGVFFYERGRTQFFLGNNNEAKKDIQMAINLGFTRIDAELRNKLGL